MQGHSLDPALSDRPTPRLASRSPVHGTPPEHNQEVNDSSYTSFSSGKKIASFALRKLQQSPKAIRKQIKTLHKQTQLNVETPPESPPSTAGQMNECHITMVAKTGKTSPSKCHSNNFRVAGSLDHHQFFSYTSINGRRRLSSGLLVSKEAFNPPSSSAAKFLIPGELPNRFHSPKYGRTWTIGYSLSELTGESEIDFELEFAIPERFKHLRQKNTLTLASDKAGAASPSP